MILMKLIMTLDSRQIADTVRVSVSSHSTPLCIAGIIVRSVASLPDQGFAVPIAPRRGATGRHDGTVYRGRRLPHADRAIIPPPRLFVQMAAAYECNHAALSSARLEDSRKADNENLPAPRAHFAASVMILYAAASVGFVFETSVPTLANVRNKAACSSEGRLISWPPASVQARRALALKSMTEGLSPMAAAVASLSTICCRSAGNVSYHFLLSSVMPKIAGWSISVTYLATR